MDIKKFSHTIWEYYTHYRRNFSWRNVHDPYGILVSEIMLQQTQTYRVEKKYDQFILHFPNFEILAQASLRDVLAQWQGLGYNRRGKYLHEIAQKVITEFNGTLPDSTELMQTFPGIGYNTAGSIICFAYNKPTIFIETNIRAVYIHHFFAHSDTVTDKELLPLIEQTVDIKNPREWYYALMDYGVYIKKEFKNPTRKSAHYAVQTKFNGSDRQIRGMIIHMLTQEDKLEYDQVIIRIAQDDRRVNKIINTLIHENMITKCGNFLFIK